MQRWDPDRSVGLLIHEVAHLFGKISDRRLQRIGLTRAQWFAVAQLRRHPGLTQTELARHLEVENPTAARLLDRMAAGGWIERRPDPADRRKRRIFLTEKLDRVLAEMESVVETTRCSVLGGLSPAAQDDLIQVLQRLKANASNILLEDEMANGRARTAVATRRLAAEAGARH